MTYIAVNDRVIDLEGGQVHHRGEATQLSPRLLTLLNYLVGHAGKVLSRHELIEGVWGHLEAATDDSVNVAVSSLRRAIGDDRRPHRILKAVPRRGYRFEPEFERLNADEAAERRMTEASGPPVADAADSRTSIDLFGRAAIIALVLAVAAAVWWLQPWSDNDSGAVAASGSAVAVLPFADMSVEGNQGPFADGLVDRIIHMLTLSPELDVVARTSSFAFRDSDAGIGEIADRLQVDAVLEGSVQHADDTVRVLAQLIDAETERHIWSRTYDRPAGELFELQDEIANEVARTMSDSLLPERDTPHAESQRVWQLITKGRFALDKFTLESATEAVGHFRTAVELEPNNVEALLGLFDALGMQRSRGAMRTRHDDTDIREPYLLRARELAPDSAMVLRATGNWHFNHGRVDDAVAAYRRAVEVNPNDALAWRHLGRTLWRQARYDDAIEPLRTAVRLDPFSGLGNVWLADAFWAVGRAEEALFRLREFIEERPEFPQAHDRIATYLAQTGETARAMRHIIRARELDPGSAPRHFRVCEFWLQLGDDESAEQCTDEFAAAHDAPFREHYLRQIIHAFRGEFEEQIRHLEAAVALGNPDPLTPALLAQAYSVDDCPRALDLLEQRYPMLFAPEPDLNPTLLLAAKTGIYCHQQTGRAEQAEPLLQAFSDWVERTRIEQGPWLVAGIEQAWLHALKGEHDAALASLEELVDDEWRYYWWGLDYYYPSFRQLRDREEFRQLIERLENGVQTQRQQFEAHRNVPLVQVSS
ncbi:MAG: tetratricopeptide repeat protein [Candidatus Wenzhouxiangella sp. M2_3B_020]